MYTFSANQKIESAKINSNFTELSGASTALGSWSTWTPTFTGLTIGSGTYVARYIQIGKTVTCYFRFTFGSGSAVSTTMFTVPVAGIAEYATSQVYPVAGACRLDTGVNTLGHFRFEQSSTQVRIVGYNNTGSYPTEYGLGATTPSTWTTGDNMGGFFTYEAA